MAITHGAIASGGKYTGLDVRGVDRGHALRLHTFMLRLRMLEEAIAREYHPADEMACPIHLCIGQEAVSAALSEILLPEDYMFSHHRGHGYYLAKHAPLRPLMAELYGKATGANCGLAGSQDISLDSSRFYGGAILAGAIGIAVGAATAIKIKGGTNIVATGFGDGATDEGIFWEAVNYAALKKLPVLFVCENNGYATYSPQAVRQNRDNISEKVAAFGVPVEDVFGNDVVACHKALENAAGRIRAGQGPFFLQAYTYRQSSHVGPEDDGVVGYRSSAEKEFWKQNCPIVLMDEQLTKHGLLGAQERQAIVAKIQAEIDVAFAFAKESPFPEPPTKWEELNVANETPLADKLLVEVEEHAFDGRQKEALPGPY